MRTAYFDCSTGIAGDMALAALIDAGADVEMIHQGIASLQLPGVELEIHEVMKSCFRAKQIHVHHPEQHAHRHYSDIVKILDGASALTDAQRALAKEMFLEVAKAEAHVHGTDIEKIHFHEVGAIDSIVDIVGVAIAFDSLKIDQVVCSPIPTGHGTVRIDHGLCAVPTPGTAEILKGIPLVDLPIEAELTTPTGAAIVKTLVTRFGRLPSMSIDQIGYGAGTMNFASRANLLRIFVGTATTQPGSDTVVLLETNLDDISAEVIGHTKQKLFEAGALDVFTSAIQMKKDRPGTLLSVITKPEHQSELEEILFAETGTLGIRKQLLERSTRSRKQHTVATEFGPVLGKLAWQSGGQVDFTPEFEDCARVAGEQGLPLREVYRIAITTFAAQQPELQLEKPIPSGQSTPSDQDHDHDHRHDHHHDHDHDHRHDHDHDHRHDHHHDHDHPHDHG